MLRPLAAALICLGVLLAPAACASASNPIQLENAKPGTTAWNLPGGTATSLPTRSVQVQGYASENSVAPGDTLDLHVSTIPAAPYRVEIYRLGWYQGTGGRLITCLPSCAGSEAGSTWPVPVPDPATGYLDAGWPVTDTAAITTGWTTGYYVAKLVLAGGPYAGQASSVPFVVRAAPGVSSPILVQASVNTWEAYNNWGGKSLYAFNSTGPIVPASNSVAAAMVSFNRPYPTTPADVFLWEYNLVRFLERSGYDVSYQTDVDTDQNPASLLGHRLDVVSGHDEYWSPAIRNAYEAARGQGVNLAFIGANIGYWQARYQNGDRTLIEYRNANLDPDPAAAQKTVRFSAPPVNRPECTLLGIGYPGGLAQSGDPPRSYAITAAATQTPWFAGTGLAAGDVLANSVGAEWDMVQRGCATPPLTVLMHFPGITGVKGSPNPADAVTYTAASGAHVFSDGSFQLVWALDDFGHRPQVDARVQHLFSNIFDTLGVPAMPRDTIPPSPFALLAPARGAVLWSPRPTLRWSAAHDPGSPLAPYVVTVDGKLLAQTPGTTLPLTRDLAQGRHLWRIIAVDQAGNVRASSTWHFTVRSVRLVRHTRRYQLRHGFALRLYCDSRCTVRVLLGIGRHASPRLVATRTRAAGVHGVTVPLTRHVTRVLRSTHAHQLTLVVKVRSLHTQLTVRFTVGW